MEAPAPLKPETKEENIREKQKYSITKDGETYILTLSTTNNDSILFNMKLDKEIIHSYYEVERNYKDLIDLSKQFFAAESLTDSWEFLIANIDKYQKEILFEINDNKLDLSLKFDYLRNKTSMGKISLLKKEYDLNEVFVKLEKKFTFIQNNQTNIEKKLDEKLSSIVSEQNDIKNNLKEKIKDIKSISLSNKKLEEIINQNQKLIKNIEETQKNFKNKFENLSEKDGTIQLECESKFKELKNYIYKNIEIDLFGSMEKKLDSIKENHDKLKNIINENNGKFSKINKKISSCQDSEEEINNEIKTLKENQKSIKNNFNDNLLKINSLELNQEKLEKKIEDNSFNNNESLRKALKDIEFLKNKLKDNEKDIKYFKEKINKLENEKSQKSDKEEKKSEYTKIPVKQQYSTLTSKREYDRNTFNAPRDSRPTHFKNFSLMTEPSPYSSIYKHSINEESNISKKEQYNRTLERNLTETNFFKRPHKFSIYKCIGSNLFNINCYNNRACIFNYYRDKNYIVYGVKTLDLMCYDCSKESSIISNPFKLFSNFHKTFFDSVRHFFDLKNSKDLIITTSLDSHVKIVDFKVKDSKLLYDFDFEYLDNVVINTAYFIENKIMIPFAFHKGGNRIAFYSLNGTKINEFTRDPGFILHLNTYYSSYSKVNFAIVSNTEGIYVYNINDYSLYNKYLPKNTVNKSAFAEGHIIEKDEKEILIGPSFSLGCLYLWNLRTKVLVSLIQLTNGITDICLWNNNYIFVSFVKAEKDKFILLNLDSKEVEKKFDDINDNFCYGIKILKHKTGDLLMTFTSAGKLYLYKL